MKKQETKPKKLHPTIVDMRVLTQKEMVSMEGNYHLRHGMLFQVPVKMVDGLDPTPAGYYNEKGEYKAFRKGKKITIPIEVIYDSGMDVFSLQDGNHRITQAIKNQDDYILAFAEAENKEMYAVWKKTFKRQ